MDDYYIVQKRKWGCVFNVLIFSFMYSATFFVTTKLCTTLTHCACAWMYGWRQIFAGAGKAKAPFSGNWRAVRFAPLEAIFVLKLVPTSDRRWLPSQELSLRASDFMEAKGTRQFSRFSSPFKQIHTKSNNARKVFHVCYRGGIPSVIYVDIVSTNQAAHANVVT